MGLWRTALAVRKPFVGGNWKMNLNRGEAASLSAAVANRCDETHDTDVAIFPPFTALDAVAKQIGSGSVWLGAQDFYHEPHGAYTGEVSLGMLIDCGVSVVLVGHSERRHVLGESDTLINEKAIAALEAEMQIILCIGETLAQREAGKTDVINAGQLLSGLAGVTEQQMSRVTIAYEPVWAIGTGKTATPRDAQATHKRLRCVLGDGLSWSGSVAEQVRVQYGGSVKPDQAPQLICGDDIDGFLVGGASLNADDFLAIIGATESR